MLRAKIKQKETKITTNAKKIKDKCTIQYC